MAVLCSCTARAPQERSRLVRLTSPKTSAPSVSPVFIPGSMGTASYVLAGEPGSMAKSFGTTCHGAGRTLSRTAARKRIGERELRRELEEHGIVVRCPSPKGLAEEAPSPTRTSSEWCASSSRPGSPVIARLVPLGVVKG